MVWGVITREYRAPKEFGETSRRDRQGYEGVANEEIESEREKEYFILVLKEAEDQRSRECVTNRPAQWRAWFIIIMHIVVGDARVLTTCTHARSNSRRRVRSTTNAKIPKLW